MLPLLQIKDLSISFETESGIVPAVNRVNINVGRGEIIGIAGESGSGKSVTSLAILQLTGKSARFNNGEILFSPDGNHSLNLLKLPANELRSIRGKEIAMIFQEPMTSLNPVYTCGEQVAEAIRTHDSISSAAAKEKTIQLFEKVRLPDPAEIYNRYPHQLSGGQKQRVMIAMAMSSNPALLICDEPTTALDVTVQKAVLDLIRDLQRETGMSVIFITHDLGVIGEIADRVVIMYKGSVVETAETQQLLSHPAHVYTKALLACRPSLYNKGTRLPTVDDFVSSGKFEASVAVENPASPEPPGPLISVKNLTVKFPVKKNMIGKVTSFTTAVDDVSFDVYKGETLGLVGESGCGKTTLGRALLRLVEPAAGSIYYENEELRSFSPMRLRHFRRNMQLIFQDPYSALNPAITVGSLVSEPLAVHFKELTTGQRKAAVLNLLNKVGLPESAYTRYAHEFSGGQRQRIVIARALALRPSFLVCDESVSALDVSVQAQVLNLLNDLKKEFGFTVIFISHDLSVIRYVSDRIMVMNKGRIEELAAAEEVCSNPKSGYTRRLLDAVPGWKPG